MTDFLLHAVTIFLLCVMLLIVLDCKGVKR